MWGALWRRWNSCFHKSEENDSATKQSPGIPARVRMSKEICCLVTLVSQSMKNCCSSKWFRFQSVCCGNVDLEIKPMIKTFVVIGKDVKAQTHDSPCAIFKHSPFNNKGNEGVWCGSSFIPPFSGHSTLWSLSAVICSIVLIIWGDQLRPPLQSTQARCCGPPPAESLNEHLLRSSVTYECATEPSRSLGLKEFWIGELSQNTTEILFRSTAHDPPLLGGSLKRF